MVRMKHLLRKLHIGGGGGGGGSGSAAEGPLEEVRISSLPPLPSSSSSATAAASCVSVSTAAAASGSSRGQSSRSSSSSSPSTSSPSPSSGASVLSTSSATALGRDGAGGEGGRGRAVSSRADGAGDLSFFEEEYQMQLALAISVSDPDGREDPESAQINAAKRMSLGCTPVVPVGIGDSDGLVQFLSHRYWNYNILNYDEKVIDGFYDVYGIIRTPDSQGKMPLLVDLQSVSISENIDYEVVLVNRTSDLALQHLEKQAVLMSMQCRAPELGPIASGLIQKIADLVVDSMGGPVGDADDMLRRWTIKSYELRTALNTIILPLGSLEVGLSRHRALLFKVLADRIDIPCRLVKGSYYTGTDDGAVNLIKVDKEREFIIDLMGAPGALIPAEIPSCHRQNAEFDLVNSSRIEQTVKDLSVALDSSTNWHFDEKKDNSDKSAASCNLEAQFNDSGSTEITSGPPKETDIVHSDNKNDTERFEHDFGKLIPSLARGRTNDAGSSTLQMKVNDVSKYVVSAAKNPEFAQKLHAVLLESGASPPPDLFSNINSSNAIGDPRKDLGQGVTSLGGNYGAQIPHEHYGQKPLANATSGIDFQDSSDGFPRLKGNTTEGAQASDPVLDDVAEWEIPWEDLQLGERIGLGSYGEVYRADWNGTEVAVKKFLDQDLSGDALEQFRCEVKIMLRLRHPNVVLFMGAVTRPPNLSILTEFLPRGSLYRLLHRPNVQLDEKRRLRMALDVAKGMNYLHTSHPTIVHRDLKSPNLLVDKNWVVKVCDFGLSRLKHHTFLSSKSTAGTPEWMAPEVLRNELSNEKSDVYSFGVILWELATLRMPWSGMNPMQVVGAVGFQNRRLDIPNDVDPMVADIICNCWCSEPNQRPSFSELMAPLKRLQCLVVEKPELISF